MRFFFRSRQFKIASCAAIAVIVFAVIARLVGGTMAPQTSLAGALAAPFQKIAVKISDAVSSFKEKISDNEELILKNAELERQINELNSRVAGYDEALRENEFYKDYLEIKKANPDFKFESATVIARDNIGEDCGFTVDVGSLQGVKVYDVVITDEGLIGYVCEAGLSTSKIRTVFSSSISVGAVSPRTGDVGIVSGVLGGATENTTKLSNLQRSSEVSVGDYITTSGSGVFPKGLLIGKVTAVSQDAATSALYANVEPFVDISTVKSVMIITDFAGKNIIELPKEDKQ